MTTIANLITAIESIAPPQLAEPWDNVGLLVGDLNARLSNAMLTIDYTDAVAAEAREKKCEAVIAYHPPIFSGLKRIASGSLIHNAIRNGVAIYSPHTALDAAPGGTNDVLADKLSLRDRRPLRVVDPAAQRIDAYKLVTFIPPKDVERVAAALFAAGAGTIGRYSQCSFRADGIGTFLGEKGTNPTIGTPGKLERTEEVRFETIVKTDRVPATIEALRRAHPYEEPAFDLFATMTNPAAKSTEGQGRFGKLPGDATGDMIVNLLKHELSLDHLLVAGDVSRMISKVGICAGSGHELFADAINAGADLYLTGELRHHDVLHGAQRGMLIICTLHTNSERIALKSVAERLVEALPAVTFHQSQSDRDPLSVM
jgi:dinuclear metal center YbgI/SA1388 family protein